MAVGTSALRKDSPGKVLGAALYVDDYAPPGCWYGATVWSSQPHARIRSIHVPDAIAAAGMVVVTAQDIPGPNRVALIADDQPMLADGLVRHVGEPVVLVAGPDREAVRAAAEQIRIDYEPLPSILTLEQAIREGSAGHCEAPKPIRIARGDLDAGFAAADLVLEGTYDVGHQEQLYIEPNGFIAWWEGARLTVQGSHQCPYYVHKAMKALFQLSEDQIQVLCTTTGGGFGGKEDFPSVLAGHCALLSRKAGHPVKMIYRRGEDFRVTTKRHPALTRYRTGVKRDGTLTACAVDFYIDCGAYITLSPVVLSRGAIHASGPYYWPAIEVKGTALATHTPPNGAFRGFGAPQVYFGIERHMDRLADALGMDPGLLRQKNLLKQGMLTATGQVLRESVSSEEVLSMAMARTDYSRRRQASEPRADGRRYGIGLALYKHGTGFTGSGEARMKSLVGLNLLPDGQVELLTASTDMGQGTGTVFPQIVSKVTGLSYDRIFCAPIDTLRVPDSGPTVASRTVTIVGRVVHNLATSLKALLLSEVAALKGGSSDDYRIVADQVQDLTGQPVMSVTELAGHLIAARGAVHLEQGYTLDPRIQWDEVRYVGDAYPAFSWGCTVAEVLVDPDTLEVEVTGLTTVHDIGTLINPLLAAGQVEGGIVQAMGYGLMEEVKWRDGHMLNPSFTNYIIPTALDVPDLDTSFFENPFEGGPEGAKGVGEIPMSGPAPALVNAISHAIGADVHTLPATPERIFEALKAGGAL